VTNPSLHVRELNGALKGKRKFTC